jgi:CRISPR/Cas system-associated endonuclease Cas1
MIKESEMLMEYVKNLQAGDISNREGHAAKVYFNKIFGYTFRRGDGSAVDSALNYGYSLILSAFNR